MTLEEKEKRKELEGETRPRRSRKSVSKDCSFL